MVDTLRTMASEHDVFTVGAEADLAAHLMAEHPGVAILDAAAVASPIERFTERLKGQFPDLILIVAGGAEDQSAVATQITGGTVYRFLHKPVSEQRVRLFVEAAWRRHGVEHSGVDYLATTAELPVLRPRSKRTPLLIGGAVLLGALLAVGAWFVMRHAGVQPAQVQAPGAAEAPFAGTPRDAVLEGLLARADKALKDGALIAPPGGSAADLYTQALRRNANDPRAGNGLEKVIDKLLSTAEEQLLAQHLDEAQKLTEQARAIKPDHVRVAFLTAQIGKERERAVLAQARQAASSGNIQRALSVLDSAAREGRPSALVTEARQELEQQKQLDERIRDYLRRADERLRRGMLVEPAEDNARFLIESARALAPSDPDVRQAQRQLADRLVAEARKSLTAGNTEQAERWIKAATDTGASRDEIAALTRDTQHAATTAAADTLAHLTQLFNQRLGQGRVVEPASDSAKFYLAQLAQTDPTNAATQAAHQAFAARTLDEAKGAVHRQDYAAARRWLSEAHDAGADRTSVGAVQSALDSAQDAARRASEFVPASSLALTHYAAPEFPMAARKNALSGWVDVQYLVKTDGSVGEVTIVSAEPVGVFEQAAVDAVRKWRYKPVMRDGQPVSQRARVRLRFAFQP